MKHKKIWRNYAIWVFSLIAWIGIIWIDDQSSADLFPLILLGMFACAFTFYNLIETDGFKDWHK